MCLTRPRYQVSVYMTIGPLVMSTVVYGIVYARRCPQLKIQKD